MDTEQASHLARVNERIAKEVLSFCRSVFADLSPPQFYARELTDHVNAAVGCAPDSACRILRYLRKRGDLDYRVVNRRESLYELLKVK